MRDIPTAQVLKRIQAENVWWREPHTINESYLSLQRRAYFELLFPLVTYLDVRRAVLLMGPRRVGKTVLLHHVIQQLIADGIAPSNICYVSVDHPIHNNCSLHDLHEHSLSASPTGVPGPRYVFFDEIQYMRDWEVQLKTLVDHATGTRFVASGSAAAALRLKSNESGAGRFTDFLLPPLTFHEYLALLGKEEQLLPREAQARVFLPSLDADAPVFVPYDIEALNRSFVHYLNFGGYPEAILSKAIQDDPARFIKGDIIDKVLLRDLPSLYGIQDIQELNYLFTTLAFNSASEVSLEQLAKSSGVAKNTIRRYIEYLEAAFLVKVVHRIDRSGRRFQRANYFKVYLMNPSIRCALFSPLESTDEEMGNLAETGILSQWFHASANLHYARWANGEVDLVGLDQKLKPGWAVEVKWSDRYRERPRDLRSLLAFCRVNHLDRALVTTRSTFDSIELGGTTLEFVPASVYCHTVGLNSIRRRSASPTGWATPYG